MDMLLSAQNRLRFWLCCGWLCILALAGGASRSDDIHQVVLQLAALLAIGWGAWSLPAESYRENWAVWLFAGACMFITLVQLVPLPFNVWASLPGRQFYADILASGGIARTAMPISLAPDRTLSTLFGLLPPLATLFLVMSLPRSDRRLLALPVLVLAIVSALLGILQIAGGSGSPLRFYDITNETDAVGLFANRNHHALLLSIGIALLGPIATVLRQSNIARHSIALLILGPGSVLLISAFTIGSRSGLLTALIAVIFTFLMYRKADASKTKDGSRTKTRDAFGIAILGAAVVSIAFLTFVLGRARSISRLFDSDSGEVRLAWIEPSLAMVKTFFPVGVGFGAFDEAFRRFEPDSLLSTRYVNMAHNDFLQLAIEGGLLGLLLLAIFAVWLGKSAIGVIRDQNKARPAWIAATSGCLLTTIIGLTSAGDYPLRTPFIASIFAIACIWILDCKSLRFARPWNNTDVIAA